MAARKPCKRNRTFDQNIKKASAVPSVNWNEVVIESLCWGWIDGVKRSLDDQAYLQRITPRKARSNWSKRNTEHAEHLIVEGRMMEPGLTHVRAAKADGRWEQAYTVSEMKVPEDFLKSLEGIPKAKQSYETLTKSDRYTIAYGLESAKRPETRKLGSDSNCESKSDSASNKQLPTPNYPLKVWHDSSTSAFLHHDKNSHENQGPLIQGLKSHH